MAIDNETIRASEKTMNKSKYEMIEFAEAGASLAFHVAEFDKYDMNEIARALREGCTLELRGCDSKDKYELVEIAQSAPGQVKFVF